MQQYKIQTAMGQVMTTFGHPLKNILTGQEIENLDKVGYTGKWKGKKTTMVDYLNSLGKGLFTIEVLNINSSEFTAEYMIAHQPQEKVTVIALLSSEANEVWDNNPTIKALNSSNKIRKGYDYQIKVFNSLEAANAYKDGVNDANGWSEPHAFLSSEKV